VESVPPITNDDQYDQYATGNSWLSLPQVISPLTVSRLFVGWNEMPISLALIAPLAKRLSVTVGISKLLEGLSVPNPPGNEFEDKL
jgi:hypothetical protein